MPTDEPSDAGLVNNGNPSALARARTPSRSSSHSGSPTTTYGTTGSPAEAHRAFCIALSMPSALPSTPAPTYGTPATSSKPWIAPRSPRGPWSTGKTTSTTDRDPSASTNAGVPSSPARRASAAVSATTSGIRPVSDGSAGGPGSTYHRPSRAIPIGTTSTLSPSSASITERADRQLISCSDERPPNSTTTRRRAIAASLPGGPRGRIHRSERLDVGGQHGHQLVRQHPDAVVVLDRHAALGDVERLADPHPDGPARPERPRTGLLPDRRRSPADHRQDRDTGGERQTDRPRPALHRQPVRPMRHGALRVDHHHLVRAERGLGVPQRALVARAARHGALARGADRPPDPESAEQNVLGEGPRPALRADDRVRVDERIQVRRMVTRDQDGARRRDPIQPLEAPAEPCAQEREHRPADPRVPGLERLSQRRTPRPRRDRTGEAPPTRAGARPPRAAA